MFFSVLVHEDAQSNTDYFCFDGDVSEWSHLLKGRESLLLSAASLQAASAARAHFS